MKLTRSLIIKINKGILIEWSEKNSKEPEAFAVNEERLDNILTLVEKQDNPISQAAYLMAGIAWAQPFSGGNKRTGVTAADTVLRLNGFKMRTQDRNDIDYIRKLLFEVQDERTVINEDVLGKIVLYLVRRLEKL